MLTKEKIDTELRRFTPLPNNALFLGVSAEDGLPVLFNTNDPFGSSEVIVGDLGCGKTTFLTNIAKIIEATKRPEKVQFAVLTNHPVNWDELSRSKSSVGIADYRSQEAIDLIDRLSDQMYGRRYDLPLAPSVLLLVDDLFGSIQLPEESQQKLDNLFYYGASRLITPFATINPSEIADPNAVLARFPCLIYGHNENNASLSQLSPSSFVMPDKNSKNGWTTFTIPN